MSDARRKLLKTTAGGSAFVALPGSWSSPVIEAVILPVHATTTGITGSCSAQLCKNLAQEENLDAFYLLFDGEICQFVQFNCCEPGALPNSGGNRIIMLDLDTGPPLNWDANDAGDSDATIPAGDDNWDVTPNPGDDNASGTYILTATRTKGSNKGNIYQVTVKVALTEPAENIQCMDVNVSFQQV